MSDTALTIALYTGAGVAVVILIFLGALWFANAAKRGNLKFKWAQRRAMRRGSAAETPRDAAKARALERVDSAETRRE